jgi:Ran GTPase-activating protein (RanGAP) involved in mRNA processing and transport
VEPDEADEEARLLAVSPRVRNLKELSLFSNLGNAGLDALAQSPHLIGLTAFSACPKRITPLAVTCLARAPWFSRLRSLSLSDSSIDDDCLWNLVLFASCPHLHTLDLSQNRRIRAGGARALAQSRAFPRLADLDLGSTSLGPEGVTTLAEARGWPLTELNLWGSRAGNAGAEALARSPLAASLRVLSLGSCGVGARGVEALAASSALASLRELTLIHNPIGPRGLLALARSPYLKNLTSLSLYGLDNKRAPITATDVRAFLEALQLPKLRSLQLMQLPVGARGAKALASSPHLGNLTQLELNKCRIPDTGAEALVESPALRGLVSLDLCFNRIKTGVRRLADPEVLPQLVNCSVVGNPIERGLAAKLRKRFPFAG